MPQKILLIFIDSLPYLYRGKMKFLSQFSNSIRKVIPGFGYSINVKAEIFGGYVPDQAGYLNEWTYESDAPLRKHLNFFSALRPLKIFYCLDRIAHRLFSKFYGQNVLNIPFEYLGFFSKTVVDAYRDEFPLPTIFSRMNKPKKICHYHYPYDKKRDYHVYFNTMKAISDQTYDNIFAAFGDLDGITHKHGIGSEEYNGKINELDNYLCQMHREFTSKNPDDNFIVISDHGMANVNKAVHIYMERQFGRASESSYLYFVDSTMLRVWTFGKGRKVEIEKYLNSLAFGKVLNKQQRINYGITSKAFGDVIFLLDEGVVFSPSFMGRKVPKAMHGYRPELESQGGLCLCLDGKDSPAKLTSSLTAIELYEFLNSQVNSSL